MKFTRSYFWFWGSVGAAILAFLYLIQSILTPFIAGFLIAYIFNPLVYQLERLSFPRGVSAILMIAAVFGTIFSFILVVLPFLKFELSFLLNRAPCYGQHVLEFVQPFLDKTAEYTSVEDIKHLKEAATGFIGNIFIWSLQLALAVLTSGLVLANILSLIVISPVVAFYLLKDWQRILAQIDRLIPVYSQKTVRHLFKEIDFTLGAYARGQLAVCGILALYYSAALLWVGLDFAVVVGTLTGLFAFVPYVGFFVGLMIGMVLAFAQSSAWSFIGFVALVYAGGQALEGIILTPNLVGGKTGLHPVWIMFALFAGGSLLGLTGVLLALPVTAALGVCVRFATEAYLKSPFYGKN